MSNTALPKKYKFPLWVKQLWKEKWVLMLRRKSTCQCANRVSTICLIRTNFFATAAFKGVDLYALIAPRRSRPFVAIRASVLSVPVAQVSCALLCLTKKETGTKSATLFADTAAVYGDGWRKWRTCKSQVQERFTLHYPPCSSCRRKKKLTSGDMPTSRSDERNEH